ncbi:MAG: HAD hydrolase-like protein, partial [Lachnospiraceae bacterium]|nr:HAD hydrolase-like protein [Lachnospiraceae bacterium]
MKTGKLYIFDMDGTLLDSMPSWIHLGRNYLIHQQITPPENLEQIIDSMTLQESAAYFQTLGLDKKRDDIVKEVMMYLRNEYRLSIPAKPGMLSLLQDLSKKPDSILCILTTSEKNCAIPALDRNHMLSYFKDIFTSGELGLSKRTAKI